MRHLGIIDDIRRQQQAPARRQPARQQINRSAADETPAMMPFLEPGIGVIDVKLAHRCRRQQVRQRGLGAPMDDPRVVPPQLRDLGFGFVHRLPRNLEAEDIAIGLRPRQMNQIFAIAEADLDDQRLDAGEEPLLPQRPIQRERVVLSQHNQGSNASIPLLGHDGLDCI